MKKINLSLFLAVLLAMPLSLRAQDSVRITFTVNDAARGAISPAGTHIFAEGEEYSVTAIPAVGYRVIGWVIKLDTVEEFSTVPLDTAISTLTTTAEVVEGFRSYTVVAIITTASIYADSFTFVIGVNDPQMGYIDPYEPGVYHFGLGQSFYFHAEANEGYQFVGWRTLSGRPSYGVYQYEDVYTDINYFGPVVVDNQLLGLVSEIIALFAPQEGFDDVNALDFNAYGFDGRIFLHGAEGREVHVFDINGRMLHHSKSANGTETYSVPTTGIYLVKVNGVGTKCVVVVQ